MQPGCCFFPSQFSQSGAKFFLLAETRHKIFPVKPSVRPILQSVESSMNYSLRCTQQREGTSGISAVCVLASPQANAVFQCKHCDITSATLFTPPWLNADGSSGMNTKGHTRTAAKLARLGP